MEVIFDNGVNVEITRNQNKAYRTITNFFKHLQHVTIPHRKWHNPAYVKNIQYTDVIDNLVRMGKLVNVFVDKDKCIQRDQAHFNAIHKVFETTGQFTEDWLNFHEHIHLVETYDHLSSSYIIDYRDIGGLLEKPFDPDWVSELVTTVDRGDLYLAWTELGKTPYVYWTNGEPNDINRIKELAKPWLNIKLSFFVASEHRDFLLNKKATEFNQWWSNYHDQWCQHWNIPCWTLEHMSGVIPIGKISNMDLFVDQFDRGAKPLKIVL